ncbi:TPR repeat protein [Actimicrobium sp. GrIS 1.19]|uniref:tetratricopeptide repeat protein n=1 Tax=Actimicrobium sp. GrIS 1.19 TaxID=3071708 RepID=UPI002E034487|nr:TPR repeat protein [Actimicrobium sp. GrIS 1.19]
MANREELLVIRAARAGEASAQLALGKRYLFGGAGLPKSEPTALYWLDRAAQQDEDEAWILIGSHIQFEAAARSAQPASLCRWYERAFDAGILQAGLVLAKLVLIQTASSTTAVLRRKAWLALEAVAHAGIGEAQWLMAQLIDQSQERETGAGRQSVALVAREMGFSSQSRLSATDQTERVVMEWTQRAADGGVRSAQHALAEHAWQAGDHDTFLQWAIPLARQVVTRRLANSSDENACALSSEEVSLLARCAATMPARSHFDSIEFERFLEAAAEGGDTPSALSLGLWFARLNPAGMRTSGVRALANYKKALRWLNLAGEHGLSEAWYAISRIYLRAEFSQRNLSDAHFYVQKAAESGHAISQLELGMAAWRARRDEPIRDVEAAYWLQRAAAQNQPEAIRLVQKLSAPAGPVGWAAEARSKLTREQANSYPLLVARLELAEAFGLTRAETLLLNVSAADCGHCLLIDIRDIHPRSRRRLTLIQTNEQRHLLQRIVRLFEDVDCGPQGPEGNYRQRLYRLRRLLKH